MAVDESSGTIYAGTHPDGLVYGCDTVATRCDQTSAWTLSPNTPADYAWSLAVDESRGTIYAGTYSSGLVYRGEWTSDPTGTGKDYLV